VARKGEVYKTTQKARGIEMIKVEMSEQDYEIFKKRKDELEFHNLQYVVCSLFCFFVGMIITWMILK